MTATDTHNPTLTEITARTILDSITADGHRLTTVEVTFPRIILAEWNTHRDFSRNSESSRAVPLNKRIARVINDPFIPYTWPHEQPGMQGGDSLSPRERQDAIRAWLSARNDAVAAAQALGDLGVHKSIPNRLLEPFSWHTVITTSTRWENFFAQRISHLAEPHFNIAANAVYSALSASTPQLLAPGQWHTPFIQPDEQHLPLITRLKLSTARSARVSYLTHDGKRDHEADLKLFDRLRNPGDGPPHWSPFEHVARPVELPDDHTRLANFDGWVQLRHDLNGL